MFEIEKAIKEQKTICFTYEGYSRVVEPYLIGISKKGNQVLSAYQVSGMSKTKIIGWKQFKIDAIESIKLMEDKFIVRKEYNPNDKNMISILARIEL